MTHTWRWKAIMGNRFGQSAGFVFTHVEGLQMSRVGKRRAGHRLDGREWREFPK